MADTRPDWREEHRHHAAQAFPFAVLAKGGELHALLELDYVAHGSHLVAARPCAGTMKCSAFQGATP